MATMERMAGQQGDIGVACAADSHFAGIIECWPPEWGGPYAGFVLDVAVAIRAGRVMVAVVRQPTTAAATAASANERVVGWIIWDDRFIPGSLYLRKAAVHQDFRNRGILGLMLTRIVDFASQASFSQIVADFGSDSKILTAEYAKRMGGELIGKVKGLAGEGYVTTFWRLKPRATTYAKAS